MKYDVNETLRKEAKKAEIDRIMEKVTMIITIIIIAWVILSFAEVLHHNNVYESTGEILEYCPINFFNVLVKLADLFGK